jgi:hypothetical protein
MATEPCRPNRTRHPAAPETDTLAPRGARARELIDAIAMFPRTTESYVRALEKAGIIEVLLLGSRRGVPRRVGARARRDPSVLRAI